MASGLVRAPMYQQLNDLLRDLIRKGEFEVGAQFLTERQISERFRVSRATANKAVSNLVSEGILEFRKGIGVFVRGGILDYDLQGLISFTEKALSAGLNPTTRVICLEKMLGSHLPAEARQKLRSAPTEPVWYMERLRCVDQRPVILEHRYVSAQLCPELSETDLQGSFYAFWAGKYKPDIVSAEQVIRAECIKADEAQLLNLSEGMPVLAVRAVGYLEGGLPLWWEYTLYRGDSYEFRNVIGPIRTLRPTSGAFLKDSLVEGQRPADKE